MGLCQSSLERREAVSRCKARRRYAKHLVQGRRDFAAAHFLYLRSLRATGAALVEFANNAETQPDHHHLLPSASPPPSPPPPPPPLASSSWDFWDLFVPSSSIPAIAEWEKHTTAPGVERPQKSSTSEVAVVAVPRNTKDLSEIVKELNEYFLKAADAGSQVSLILEAPNSDLNSEREETAGKTSGYGKNLNRLHWSWRSNSKICGGEAGSGSLSHSSTVEKLYNWEKKLYSEVKNAEMLREQHDKRVTLLRKQEANGVDYVKVEKNMMEIERLKSKMTIASEAIETITSAIIVLIETELFPQLLQLVTGLMGMWKTMHSCHQDQTRIGHQLECLNSALAIHPTSNMHHQASLRLQMEIDRWRSSFFSLIKSQREYTHSLAGWFRLSLFHCHAKNHPTTSDICSLCEELQLAIDRVPDEVASEGIKSFLAVIQAIIAQQEEEQNQEKRAQAGLKELLKRSGELASLESKLEEGHGEAPELLKKRAEVEPLKKKTEEEKSNHEKCVAVTRELTLNNLQAGLPQVFQAMSDFSGECMQAFESAARKRHAECG